LAAAASAVKWPYNGKQRQHSVVSSELYERSPFKANKRERHTHTHTDTHRHTHRHTHTHTWPLATVYSYCCLLSLFAIWDKRYSDKRLTGNLLQTNLFTAKTDITGDV